MKMNYSLKKVVVGYLEENCYILNYNNKTYLIDPGDEPKKIKKELKNVNELEILITHHHYDHVGALDYFEKEYNTKHNNFNNPNFEIIKNPGHSKDSISFYFKDLNIMFCGDFIFKNNIGRTDFIDGSMHEMRESLKNISNYADDIILYPGHDDSTILGDEKKHFKIYF